jgi:MFS family permease
MKLRNVTILALCQAIGLSGAPMLLLLGSLIGATLAPSPTLSTLPITAMSIGLALTTAPASLLAGRWGRRRGFILAMAVAGLGLLLAAYAINIAHFALFCVAALLIGVNLAFVGQYRFAAAESVDKPHAAKAISFVLLGGIVAGLMGPEIGRLGKDWLNWGDYSGSFMVLAVLYALGVLLMTLLREVVPAGPAEGAERLLKTIVAQPAYLLAVWGGVVAYGVMVFVMTATPISMHVFQGYGLTSTAAVIQAHLMAMYLPSLFSGFLLDRFGANALKIAGLVGILASVTTSLFGGGLASYFLALIALGIGWNFLFVGATFALTQTYLSQERFKAQAVNEMLVFGMQALATLAAGPAIYRLGWRTLNLATLPILLFTLLLMWRFRPKAALR